MWLVESVWNAYIIINSGTKKRISTLYAYLWGSSSQSIGTRFEYILINSGIKNAFQQYAYLWANFGKRISSIILHRRALEQNLTVIANR
jgi:hypothetical protein